MNLTTLDDVETESRRVLLRLDLNSPLDPSTGRILDDHRFDYHRATLRELDDAAVAVLAHQSRPGKDDFSTLERHAEALERAAGRPVTYVGDYFGPEARRKAANLEEGEVALLENVRFYSEETMDLGPRRTTSHPVESLAPLFDLFVNDAFACAHRNHISVTGFPGALPSAAGRLMEGELSALERASPSPGTLFLLGGAKVGDSLRAAKNVLSRGARVAATGLFANLLLAADGVDLGEPSLEVLSGNGSEKLLDEAQDLLRRHGDDLVLPVDLAIESEGDRVELSVSELPAEAAAQDIGLETISRYTEEIEKADSVVCNGPAGVFESDLFALGTEELLRAMAESESFSVVGGGHIVTALRRTGLESSMDHVSSGGGALLSYVSGDELPGVEALRIS